MKKKNYLFLAVLLFLSGWFFYASRSSAELSAEEISKNVVTQKVVKGSISKVHEFSGTVKGDSEVEVSSKISAEIKELYVSEGDWVQKGQLIAVLDGNELIAGAGLAGEAVASGQRSLEASREYYEQTVDEAKANVEKAEEAYDIAKDDGDDEKKLAKKTLEAAEESYSSAKRMRDLMITISENELSLAKKENLIAQIQADNTKITAPFSGIITRKYFDAGSLVSAGSSIVSLAKSEKKEIEIFVPTAIGREISKGDDVSIFKNETKGGKNELFGKIASFAPSSDDSHKIAVVISLENADELILGELVRVGLELERKDDTIVVPLESVRKDYYENIVFVRNDGKAEKRIVELGLIEVDKVEVISGLKKGDELVVSGQQYLKEDDSI